MLNRSQAIRNVIIFALLVNGFAWLGSFLGGDPVTPAPGFLLWGVTPLLSALIMRFVLRDPVTLGIRPNLRGNRGWYALSLLLYPISILAILGVGLLLGTTRIEGFTLPAFFTAMAASVIIYFVFALFEEVAWRGYLATRVSEINDRLPGYLIVRLIWASWHFPYLTDLWAHTDESMLTLVPVFCWASSLRPSSTARSGCAGQRALMRSYQQTKPPSTIRSVSVQNAEAALARKTAGPTMSSTPAIRLLGVPSSSPTLVGRWKHATSAPVWARPMAMPWPNRNRCERLKKWQLSP